MKNTITQPVSSISEIVEETPKIKYCLYARKSTESDEKQMLSIDSQIKEMLRLAERDKLEVAEIRNESHSAKETGQRPVFNKLLEDMRGGKFNGIITWAPDRLSRNAGDLGALVDLMDQKVLLEIRTFGQRFSNSPNEKFLLMILCSQAKLENDQKGINVKRGLRAKCEMGLRPGTHPTGYLHERRTDRKSHAIIDPVRAPVIKQMFEKVANEQCSGRSIYRWLKYDLKFKTKNGKHLALANIYILLKNPFYCGIFEYPVGSGNWYTGKHVPIITKELFDKVQKQLTRNNIKRSESKEFAFTKLIQCGLCNSGITADEKFKRLKNGGVNRHVYYICTKSKNIDCKNKSIRENDLLDQLLKIIDKISLDKIGTREKIEKEIERYNNFRCGVLGNKKEQYKKSKEIDIRNYAKYILKEGTVYEKRELLSCLKTKLILKNKELHLEK